MANVVKFSVVVYTKPSQQVLLSGSIEELGCWNAADAVSMHQSAHFSAEGPSFWYKEVQVPCEYENLDFQYKFLLYDGKDYAWEGQGPWDNRQWKYDKSCLTGGSFAIPVAHWREKSGHSNEFHHTTKFYREVASRNLIHYSKIFDNLYLGSCPRVVEHIAMTMKKELKITAVMNFQTKEDVMKNSYKCYRHVRNHVSRGVGALENVYREHGMSYVWLPVTDMSSEARQQMLPHAVCILKGLLDNGHTVYVHCNAGVGRSVAVVCGYILYVLNWNYRKMEQHIFNNRPVAYLDPYSLHEAWKDYRVKFGRKNLNHCSE